MPGEQRESDRCAANPLARQRHHDIFLMLSARIQARRIAEAVLQIDRRRHTHQVGRLVVPYRATQVVWCLHIEINRRVYRLPVPEFLLRLVAGVANSIHFFMSSGV